VVATVGEREDSFDELFVANYALLTRVIYRVVGDAGSAEELASEAFWKLYRNPPATRQNLEGWLYRTGLRLALDTLRKRKRRARYEALAPTPGEVANPEDALHQREEAARVRRVLAALKPEQASLLVLRGEGYRLAEIAALLSVHANSTGTLLARADAAFRKDYVRCYGER
jgi:RNA polymerase sigma-70 factor (ECF subfamily)